MRAGLVLLLLALLITLPAGVASAQGRITEIEVRENTKTTEGTVIQISRLEVGDQWTAEKGAVAETELRSSGLFKEVLVSASPSPNGVKVVIIAKDKHAWIVAPTYYDQPTNRGGGAGFGHNNLFGENKKLLLYGQVATGDSFFIGAYVDPAIRGSRFMWMVDVLAKSARSFEYAAPTEFRTAPEVARTSRMQYLNLGVVGGITIFDDLTFNTRLRGAHVSYPWSELPDGTPTEAPGDEGWDVSSHNVLTWDTRSNWLGVVRGSRLRVEYERAIRSVSDFDYTIVAASAEHNHVFFARHNLNMRSRIGRGWEVPFQTEFTSGGISLRGYQNDQFRGDFKWGGNVEYSVPVVTVFGVALRLMGFVDATYTTFLDTENTSTRSYLPDAEVRGIGPLRTSIGAGVRTYLKQVVIPLLGYDFGYSPETGEYAMYFALGVTDW